MGLWKDILDLIAKVREKISPPDRFRGGSLGIVIDIHGVIGVAAGSVFVLKDHTAVLINHLT
jgi:hypothetical protein